MSRGYVVTVTRDESGDRPFCDAPNVNYGETCSNRASYRMVGGRDDGSHYCTRHVNRRSRYRQKLHAIPVSRQEVDTLEAAEAAVAAEYRKRGYGRPSFGPPRGTLGEYGPLPDGSTITVEQKGER